MDEDEAMKAAPAMKAALEIQQRSVGRRESIGGGMLNTGLAPAPDVELLARVVGDMSVKIDALSATIGEVLMSVALLRATPTVFSDEDVELIKQHVRHPGALEAAKLKERLRCVASVLERVPSDVARSLLESE